MELRYIICGLVWTYTVLALGIPLHHGQQPLLPDRAQVLAQDHTAGIMLEFTQRGSEKLQRFEIPIRAPTFSGIDLPTHPSTMRIVAAINEQGHSASLEALKGVICRVVPKITVEEKASKQQRVLPWFAIADGAVHFERSNSRWYLGGRSIGSYECR